MVLGWRRVLAGAAFLAAISLFAGPALAAPARATTHPLLVGQDGPGFTITLKRAGRNVTTLKAGTYTLRVLDKSSIHNFHLTGPGVNKRTSVGRAYTVTWTVTLRRGTYRYVCDPHAEIMRGSFRVT
jgi:plastocyanin